MVHSCSKHPQTGFTDICCGCLVDYNNDVAELTKHRWIPVEEPPKDMIEVWVIGGGLIETGRYMYNKWQRIGHGGGLLTNITHWKPIILPGE